jgi:hypothetical protein
MQDIEASGKKNWAVIMKNGSAAFTGYADEQAAQDYADSNGWRKDEYYIRALTPEEV